MKTSRQAANLLIVLFLLCPLVATWITPALVRADTGLSSKIPRKYAGDNYTSRVPLPAFPAGNAKITSGLTMQSQSILPPKRSSSSNPRRSGAGFLDEVYVNVATGDDSYTGSSPTVQPGGIGPKKTIQAGILEANDYGVVYVAAGIYSENITIDIGIDIIGDGARDTIIDAGSRGAAIDIIAFAEDIFIEGFTIRNGNGDFAGGIVNGFDCILIIVDCAIINNTGIVAGGIYNEFCGLYIFRSLIANNTGGTAGGGIVNYDAELLLLDSTVSGNTLVPGSYGGGGIYNLHADAEVIESTLAHNSAPGAYGGGFACEDGYIAFYSTIVANNTAGLPGNNNGYYDSLSELYGDLFNIDSENSCRFSDPTSQVNANPMLGPLQNNGGPTNTHAISTYGAAFEKGGPLFWVGTDQRGVTRPQGVNCDVGAFELELSPRGSVKSAVGTGQDMVTFSCSEGGIARLTALRPNACSRGAPQNMDFPYGLFAFNIVGIAPGATVRVTITFPRAIAESPQYWKCNGSGEWVNCTHLVSHTPGDSSIMLTLTDGGPGDMDGIANGRIVDPGGLAWPNVAQQPHSAYVSPPQQPVALPGISVRSATLSSASVDQRTPVRLFTVLSNKGTADGAMKLTVYVNGEAEASRAVTVASGSTVPVTFDISRETPGTYQVYVGGTYAGAFTVSDMPDDNMILFISCILLFTALITGLYMSWRRLAGVGR